MGILSEVCTILTGFTARGRLEPAEQDGILALQLRDISPGGSIALDSVMRIHLDDVPERYFVRTGDVVFRSRGERNTAAVVDESIPEPALGGLAAHDSSAKPAIALWRISGLGNQSGTSAAQIRGGSPRDKSSNGLSDDP